ncbi:hypothetical protein COMA2_130111 [Candidatus Nitrospira nitrificans]|uniref:Methyltransferase domain-containing protein n=1 Tax=Candidatus Nitrospira nitrificans TaxID=1742973 RepID=A0A0S4LAB2_9BACT|nr:hypothetical protein COMA2_130111 [Candidatus Nitrospira nitrificans]
MTLTATDINPGMLDYAQRKLKDLKGVDWRQADIAHLPFPGASFEAWSVSSDSCSCRIKTAPFEKCAESWSMAACWHLTYGIA